MRSYYLIICVLRLVPGAQPVATPHASNSVDHYYTREIKIAEVGNLKYQLTYTIDIKSSESKYW